MSAGPASIVWILGAGFSRPVGGPLLPDLISERSLREVLRKSQSGDDANASTAMLRGYQTGGKQRLWTDAEDFLAQVEAASAPDDDAWLKDFNDLVFKNPDWRAWDGTGLRNVSQLNNLARKMVVAACSDFLQPYLDTEDDDLERSEILKPYFHWRRKLLGHTDTVITLNYDVLCELIGRWRRTFNVVLQPTNDPGLRPDRGENGPTKVPLLKLHGSVDWALKEDRIVKTDDLRPSSRPLIGTPGPSKGTLFQDVLNHQRVAAKAAVEKAATLVFVGYRFPESDVAMLEHLTEAIRENLASRKGLRVVVVLGPHPSADKDRMRWILKTVGVKHVCFPPAWSQDFLLVRRPREHLLARLSDDRDCPVCHQVP